MIPFFNNLSNIISKCTEASNLVKPNHSLDFEYSSAQSLSISKANFGTFDRAKFAVSVWLKAESFFTGGPIFHQYVPGTRSFSLVWAGGGTFDISTSSDGSTATGRLVTSAAFNSTSTWYHLLFHYDSANATAGDRMRLWINGTEITSFGSDVNPSSPVYDSSDDIRIGEYGGAGYDGLMYQFAFFSGHLPSISDLYNAGSPLPIRSLPGIHSMLEVKNGVVTDDYVLTPNWTNNGGVSSSTTIPS